MKYTHDSLQKGFSLIGILIVIAVIAGIGAGIFKFGLTGTKDSQVPIGDDVQRSSDIDSSQNINNQGDLMFSGDIDISDWKTYRNEEYGFGMKYPSDFFLKEQREYQDDALNPTEDYTTAVFITNYPKEIVRGPLANFNLSINFFRQAPESFASVVGLPLQTIILGTEVYKFVEYDESLNYSSAGFRAKYFLATPLVKDIWITFDHLPLNEGDGGDVFLVKSAGDFLDYFQQKQIARTILSTLKFLP